MDGNNATDLKALGDRLRLLEDERSILQTLYRYGHTIDFGLAKEWADCFTENGVFETRVRESGPPTRYEGRSALTQFVVLSQPPGAYVKHGVLEPVITIDGNKASVVTYWFMLRERGISEPYLRGFGYYRDRMVRCADGKWRFKERVAIAEASTSAQPDGKLAGLPESIPASPNPT